MKLKDKNLTVTTICFDLISMPFEVDVSVFLDKRLTLKV